MKFFEYPYVIITILAMFFLLMCLVGVYFTFKSVKTARGTAGKSFCGIGKIESDFEKAGTFGKKRSVVYISISLDGMKRIYSEAKATRMYEQIKRVLLGHFCFGIGGEISLYGKENFVALNYLDAQDTAQSLDKCLEKLNEVLLKHSAVNVARVNFGYHCTSSTEVSFKTAFERAKQACGMAEDKGDAYCEWDS